MLGKRWPNMVLAGIVMTAFIAAAPPVAQASATSDAIAAVVAKVSPAVVQIIIVQASGR